MGENGGSKVSYFIVGLGLGALVGILFAPKSGEETRDFLVEKADEGSKYAQRKAREQKERAEDLIEKSKEVAARQKESITAATSLLFSIKSSARSFSSRAFLCAYLL